MKAVDLTASLALHAVAFGVVAAGMLWPSPKLEPDPIYFEVIEAAAVDLAAPPAELPSEEATPLQSEAEAESVPFGLTPVPQEVEKTSIPEEGSVPLDDVPETREDDDESGGRAEGILCQD